MSLASPRPWPRALTSAPFLAALCAMLGLAGVLVPSAHAAATVSKFSLVISGDPLSIDPKDFNNKVIGQLNRAVLQPRGLESLSTFKFAWLFDASGRYFIRPNVTIEAGVGQLRSIVKREFLPQINASIQYRAEILSVPVHVGGDYYLPPYNQGDFRAQVYLGAGMNSNVYNRARLQAVESRTDSATTLGGNYKISAKRDSPGYYLETGVHMFFAARYSVMLGVLYRSAVVRNMQAVVVTTPGGVKHITSLGTPFHLDTSGIGGRFAISIGL